MAKRILTDYNRSMPPAKSTPVPETIECKLDKIILHLEKIDRRDRVRMIGGYFKFLISLIPIVFLLVSAWYFIEHGGDILKMIADQAASSAAAYTKDQGSGMFDQLMKQVTVPKK